MEHNTTHETLENPPKKNGLPDEHPTEKNLDHNESILDPNDPTKDPNEPILEQNEPIKNPKEEIIDHNQSIISSISKHFLNR